MSVVVTGAAGFIGMHLVDALIRAGHAVVGIDRRFSPGRTGHLPMVADLLDGNERVDQALRSADAVFHLAGRAGVRDPDPRADLLRRRDNVSAMSRVLGLVPLSVPLLVASSSSIYGGSLNGRASREDDPPRPRGGYATSKVEAEQLCARRAEAGGTVIVCRPFTVAGEGQRHDMAIAQWIRAVEADRPVQILGHPRRRRDITDVRDVVAAMTALIARGTTATVNIGTGVGHTLADVADAVGRAVGRTPRIELCPASQEDPPDTLADISRLVRLTGRTPRTNLPALIERQVRAVRRQASHLHDGLPTRPADMPRSLSVARPEALAGTTIGKGEQAR